VGVRLPPELPDREPNHHVFYLLYPDETTRDKALDRLREAGVMASFHYVPLHSAPQGRALEAGTEYPVTDRVAATLLRLPLHPLLTDEDVSHVVESVREAGPR
jgi:dTDP-4-amino-4,6-dideoxygalactose transaminase